MNDDHVLRTVDDLVEVIGQPVPRLEHKVRDTLDEFATDFLAKCPFLVLSTSDAEGRVDASPKGDAAGFVLVESERSIVIPDRTGNKLVFGHKNILENPRVGVLCLIPGTPETMRINGRAELTCDPELLERMASRGKPALLGVRVHVEEYFFHCAKAFLRSGLWRPDGWPERHSVSFGAMYAKWIGADQDTARAIDQGIAKDYVENL